MLYPSTKKVNILKLTALINLSKNDNDFVVNDTPVTEEIVKNLVESTSHIFLIEESEGEYIGYTLLTRPNFSEMNMRLKISSLFIKETFRQQGFAKKLLERVSTYATESDVKSLYLEVVSGNKSAISLYEKAGFSHVGKLSNSFRKHKNLYDIFIYEKAF